jgi:hypothetical protein
MPVDFSSLRDLDGNPYVPVTLEEAVDYLYGCLDDHEKRDLREHGGTMLHFGFGMALRNHWNLWETRGEQPLVRDIVSRFGVAPGDDVSGKILDDLAERCGYVPKSDRPPLGKDVEYANGAGQQSRGSNPVGDESPPPRDSLFKGFFGRTRQG